MPGRNDPCPCGSGRKFKQCCLQAQESSDFRWRQLRAAEGRLVPELLRLALEGWGPTLMRAALDEFFLWEEVPEDYLETEEFSAFFVPWFVYEFVADPHEEEAIADAPREPLASLYARRHADRLSPAERAFLDAAATSSLSFHAITRVVSGREIALADVLTGVDLVVREQSASTMVQPGALIFARVVSVGDTSILSGCAPLVIPPSWHLPIIDVRDRYARGKGRHLSPETVADLGVELRELYFEIEDRLYNPRLPELQNTDGDPLEPTVLTYRLGCPPAVALDRLKSLARFAAADVTDLLSDAVLDDSGALSAVTLSWSKRGNRLHKDWDNTTLGTVRIDRDRLTIEVNSRKRATRIAREVKKRLGADAVLESRKATTMEQLLAERAASPRDALDDLEHEQLQAQPEVQEYLREQNARHWEAWLDMPIPALDNRTPRQAARSAAGRERLEALFVEFTWGSTSESNPMAPDVPALRASLGLK